MAETENASIWSVRKQTRDIYFVVFAALFLGGLALEAHEAFGDGVSALAMTRTMWESAAPVAITSAAAAMLLTEAGRILIVVIAERLEARFERKGQQKERQRWVEWNKRREAAQQAGQAFDEPPPADSDAVTSV